MNHTDYSNFRLRDSINQVETLIDRALQLGHSVVAITEHETIASSIRAEKYYEKIKKQHPEFKLIRGNEIYLCRNGLNAQNFNKEVDKYYHFILLARDAIGHEQIREISNRAWSHSYVSRKMMRVPTYYQDLFDVIGSNPGHVIGCTACIGGALGTQLLKYQKTQEPILMDKIEFWCNQLHDLFGEGNFYLEMQPSHNKEQLYVNKHIVKLSDKLNIPYIITTDSHYLSKEDRPIHKAYLNAQDGDREVDDFYATTYMMGTDEIYEYMEQYLGEEVLQKAFSNINKISDMCEDFSIKKSLKIPRLDWKQPMVFNDEIEKNIKRIPELKKFITSDYEEDVRLAGLIVEKIENDKTLQNKETYDEINECLKDTWISSEVNGARWSAYFLNLQNIIDTCWDAGSLVGCGRGSGVGFILLYILGITQINPLREKTATYRWRFLNPERVSVLDVDIDIEGSRRQNVLNKFREVYGSDRVANVLTLGTEKAKSAIQTAARGLGIDNDIAQYLSSMVASDRGIQRTLKQTYYGDEENGFLPNKQFKYEMDNNYPELWELAQRIEGLICRVGVHAGGVIFVDEPFTKSTALMKAPSGEIITQFDLHDAEEVGLIKYDILSVEALDKIHNCLDLLVQYNYIEDGNLRDVYENTVGIYKIEREEPKMWKMLWNHDIMSLFQMEQQSGIQGIAAMKPTSVDDLAILNSAIRLMAQEKGMEIPVQKLARFKKNPQDWDSELAFYGLTKKEKEIIEPVVGISYGLCIAQEQFMQLVQLPELGEFNLTWADKLRKSIAKKNPAEYEKLTHEFFEVTKEKGCNEALCKYVWNVLIAMSRGYGFNQSHTLAYSLIALQEMNLAYKYPIIFWNCACLITDSGGAESEGLDDEGNIREVDECETIYVSVEDFGTDDEETEDSDEDEDLEKTIDKKKKKNRNANFGKIATAIGKMKSVGIEVTSPNINSSGFTFSPDVNENVIRFGLSGITRVGEDLIHSIIENRPYSSLEDFLSKVKVNKPQMINLIKSGAFDSFGDSRNDIMDKYIRSVSDQKKRVTLQNMKMLIDFNLLPDELDFQKRVFNFNKYLKKFKDEDYYLVDDIALDFLDKNYSIDELYPTENGMKIKQTTWDKIYKKEMDAVRAFIKEHHDELLDSINNKLISDMWNKYCLGSLSKWEMDAVSCYFHNHELENANLDNYEVVDYFDLPENPEIDRVIPIKGKQVPLFKIRRIAGTVLDRDKNKKNVTLLTTSGVVTVKIYGDVFTQYDKQISEKGANGKKHVLERSWFSRGNKIIVTGIRREDTFLAKKYSRTPYHLVELIEKINDDGSVIIRSKRVGEEE